MSKTKRSGINFRQSAKSFRGAKGASIWRHIIANLPYKTKNG